MESVVGSQNALEAEVEIGEFAGSPFRGYVVSFEIAQC